MKNKMLKGLALLSVLTVMFACNTKKEEPIAVDKEQVKKEIQAKEDEFAAVYNSGEIKSIGYYDDNAITFYQNRAPLVGKAAIVEFLKADAVASSNKISFKTTEVFVSNDGNQVVETGAYTLVDSTNATLSTGNYISLFEKKDGKYVCVRDMSASDGQATE
ncbi:ketosteroid isomerase-like protein [Flavobacterium cutihirudinis]|uniref:Ketosteroid isomerase-like protein n=1 Tax=Flavobacterium cutihirudinis TaxID=1265740 RepID=A0A3D9FUS0_9FLAO|nr:nuclear transport factor 2 family protein [Flavobacterium cutihirudinis]RED23689.1 ketosteroid isomerase-like protein [Flavobacterium cutihirudinis]